jgi:hypothetical protein
LLAAQLITGTGDILVAMILVSSVPLLLYAALIGAVRERTDKEPVLRMQN